MTTTEDQSAARARRWGFIWNLFLGFLISALSVLTAASNYLAYRAGNVASDHDAEGERSLALSNTDYIQANQYIILDYTMYDGERINRDIDDFAADYYQSNFSLELQGSINRDSPFDDQYYAEMYATSNEAFDSAFASFDLANAEEEREAGYQLAMLIAAVGLAFAAYASLLDNVKFLRGLFSVLAFVVLLLATGQFLSVLVS
jgi:hypothetical protein